MATLILLDYFFLHFLGIPMFFSSIIFLSNNRYKNMVILLVSIILDIVFSKIYLSVIVILIIFISKYLKPKNFRQFVFSFSLIYIVISLYFKNFNFITLLKIMILVFLEKNILKYCSNHIYNTGEKYNGH